MAPVMRPTGASRSSKACSVMKGAISEPHPATFRVLFVLLVLSHGRRRLVHFNVTEHPTAEWTA